MSQVKVTMSGTCFVFNRDILQGRPFQKLPQLVNDAAKLGKPLEFSFDRPSSTFTYILGYYESGELHMPMCVCPGFFQGELQYWGIEPEELAECCYYRYVKFQNDLDTQRKFKKETMATTGAALPMVAMTSTRGLAGFRHNMWRVVDSNTATLTAKVYFCVVIFMVLLSVCTLAFSTEPSMRRPLNKCELLEYLEYTHHPQRDFIKISIGTPSCSGNVRSSSTGEVETEEYDWKALWGNYFDYYMYGGDDEEYDNTGGTTTRDQNGGITTIPTATNTPTTGPSTTTTTETTTLGDSTEESDELNETATQNALNNPRTSRKIDIPQLTVPKFAFDVLEWIAMAFFTLDLALRLFSCPSLKTYFLSFLNIIDACALVCSYIYVIVLNIRKEYRYEDSWIRTLEFLQIFRVMRLFRVVQNVRATQVLAYSMWQNVRDITLLGFLLFMAVALFSTVLYFTEDQTNVKSIPQAWYWAIITLTTVGYGDISPKTFPGQFVASVCAVCGIILLAVTLPIFVNNFLVLYEFACVEEANEGRKSKGFKRSLDTREVSVDNTSPPPSHQNRAKTNVFFVAPKLNDANSTTLTKE